MSIPRTYTQEIVIKEQALSFCADSSEEMTEWISVLRQEIIKATQVFLNTILTNLNRKTLKKHLPSLLLLIPMPKKKRKTVFISFIIANTLQVTPRSRDWFSRTQTAMALTDEEKQRRISVSTPSTSKERTLSVANTNASETIKERRVSNADMTKKPPKTSKAPPPIPSPMTIRTVVPSLANPIVVPIKSCLFYNIYVGSSNALYMLTIDTKVDVERVPVHLSWVLPSFTGDKK